MLRNKSRLEKVKMSFSDVEELNNNYMHAMMTVNDLRKAKEKAHKRANPKPPISC